MKIIIFILILSVVVLAACSFNRSDSQVKEDNTKDGTDVFRDGVNTDINSAYWESRFNDLGQEKTFELFQVRFEEIHIENEMEAIEFQKGFARFCKLNQCLVDFNNFQNKVSSPGVLIEESGIDRAPNKSDAIEVARRVEGDPSNSGWEEIIYKDTNENYFIHIISGKSSQYSGAEFSEWLTKKQLDKWMKQYLN